MASLPGRFAPFVMLTPSPELFNTRKAARPSTRPSARRGTQVNQDKHCNPDCRARAYRCLHPHRAARFGVAWVDFRRHRVTKMLSLGFRQDSTLRRDSALGLAEIRSRTVSTVQRLTWSKEAPDKPCPRSTELNAGARDQGR